MVVSETIAGLGAIKTAFDVAKGLKDINDIALRNAAVIELQEHILTAQQTQSALTEQISQLEKEVAGFEAWDREKERYELKELEPGSFAYALKEDVKGAEPTHYLCTSCYENEKKQILQGSTSGFGTRHLACPTCKMRIDHSRGPDHPQPEPPGYF